MSIEINIEDLNSIDREDELTLEERLSKEASRVHREALTGDRRSPKEQLTEFFGDPIQMLRKMNVLHRTLLIQNYVDSQSMLLIAKG